MALLLLSIYAQRLYQFLVEIGEIIHKRQKVRNQDIGKDGLNWHYDNKERTYPDIFYEK